MQGPGRQISDAAKSYEILTQQLVAQLNEAITKGDVETVKKLLKAPLLQGTKSSLASVVGRDGKTALQHAVAKYYFTEEERGVNNEIVDLLIRSGADLTAKDSQGRRLLCWQ